MEEKSLIISGLDSPIEAEKGFSLIEVMAALCVVSLLVVYVNSAFLVPYRWSISAKRETIATNLANFGLEILRTDKTKLDEANQGQSFADLFPEISNPEDEMSGEIVRIQPWCEYPNLYTVIVRVMQVEEKDSKCWEFGTVIKKQ